MYQYQFSNKQNLKIQNKRKICFKRVWWRKNPTKLFSVMSIKGRSGSLGSGKGMGAELAERSFPWETTQKSSAGKSQRQSREDSGEGVQKCKEGVQKLPATGPGARSLPVLITSAAVPCPCCASRCPWTPRQQPDLSRAASLCCGEREHRWPRWEGEHVLGEQWSAPKLPSLVWCGFPTAGYPAHPPSCPAFPGIIQRWGEKLHGRCWELEVSLWSLGRCLPGSAKELTGPLSSLIVPKIMSFKVVYIIHICLSWNCAI